jgi:DNA-binding protein H-NS
MTSPELSRGRFPTRQNETGDDTMSKTEEQILAEQKQLADDLARLRADEIDALRADVANAAAKRGQTFDAFVAEHFANAPKQSRNATGRGNGTPKYRHPERAELTWSGKGPTPPKWMRELMDDGWTAESLLIDGMLRHNGNGAHA